MKNNLVKHNGFLSVDLNTLRLYAKVFHFLGFFCSRIGWIICLVFLLFSCATLRGPKKSTTPLYYAQGSGKSALEAIRNAKLNAIQKVTAELLDKAGYAAHKQQVYELIKDIPDAFIVSGTLKTIQESRQNNSFYYVIGVRVAIEPLVLKLKSEMIYGGKITPSSHAVPTLADESGSYDIEPDMEVASDKDMTDGINRGTGKEANTVQSSEAAGTLSDEEKEKIVQYLRNLSFMVYYDEPHGTDPFLIKTAVNSANRYLAEKGYEYRDLEQIEKIKKDQELAYEEETGKSISMVQWIANKLHADVYIEIVLETEGKQKDNKYYGSATLTMNNFDASTGEGRGAAFFQTNPPAFSTVSTQDAIQNAVASAAYKAIPDAIAQAKVYMEKAARQGMRYDLIIQNSRDPRLMREFSKALEKKVKYVRTMSQSEDETRYEVRLVGSINDLEDIVYDIADSIPNFGGMYMVYLRGNSITFDTGL